MNDLEELKKDFVSEELDDATKNVKAIKSENLLLRSIAYWDKTKALRNLLNFLKKQNALIKIDNNSVIYDIFHKPEIHLLNIEINENTQKIILITKIGKATNKNLISYYTPDTYQTLSAWISDLKKTKKKGTDENV